MTPPIKSELGLDDILKYFTFYAFRRGNWQQPIDPKTDKEYLEVTQALTTLVEQEVVKGQLKALNAILTQTGPGHPIKKSRIVSTITLLKAALKREKQ